MEHRSNSGITIDIRNPQYFSAKEVLIMNFLGGIWGFIMGVLLGGGIICFVGGLYAVLKFGTTAIIILGLYALPVALCLFYFLPFPVSFYIKNIMKLMDVSDTMFENARVFQISCIPRYYRGLRGFFEDADDFGILSLGEEALSFHGDLVHLKIPYSDIRFIQTYYVGFVAFLVYGKRIRIHIRNTEGFHAFEFFDRSSSTITASRRTSKTVYQALLEKMG